MPDRESGLYIHVPFCVRKCAYCDFCSVGIGEGEDERTGRMVTCLIRELASYELSDVGTVFIGGGTPSVLPLYQTEKLLKAIRNKVPKSITEFTVECNPGTVDEEKLRLFRDYGVNRLSIGCQSIHDSELAALGRIHTATDFFESFETARRVGFSNINIDLMTAIPGQSAESLTKTLQIVTNLAPEHLSVYSLILEDGTPLYETYKNDPPVKEEEDTVLYDLTCRMLAESGYRHYEVSNYARPGCECKHNQNYWRRGNYIGIGPAASSHENGVRRTNTKDMDRYMTAIETGQAPDRENEVLSPEQKKMEALFLGLRTAEGIRLSGMAKEFSFDPDEEWRETLEEFVREGLLIREEDVVRPTERGLWLSDYIIEKLL